MAGGTLFTLLDDIATLLDDIATMTKVAVHKTAGVLGDDLALNAYQVSGVAASRELPVVWAVSKGSLVNKAILVPLALLISAIAPWAVMPLLMIGGLYLCYEGVEKITHRWHRHSRESRDQHAEHVAAITDPTTDIVAFEKAKIRGAIRTDFVLSAEIIVISLGAVAERSLATQVGVLIAISLIMTVGVYGFVAGIVKLDDVGAALLLRPGASWWPRFQRSLGLGLIRLAPHLLKLLSFLGTLAMFLVGGHIVAEGIPPLSAVLHHWESSVGSILPLAGWTESIAGVILELITGLLAGGLVLAVVTTTRRFLAKR